MIEAALIPAGASLLGSLLGSLSNRSINQANIEMQQETNAQNERLMRESWQRDDTAVQRRKTDLLAAGISPLLAAGSSAAPSSPISYVSPKKDREVDPNWIQNAVSMGMGSLKTLADIRNQKLQTESQAAYTDALRENADLDNWSKSLDIIKRTGKQYLPIYDNRKRIGTSEVMIHNKGTDLTEAEKRNYDLWLSKKFGVRTTDPMTGHEQKKGILSSAVRDTAAARNLDKATDLMFWNTLFNGANSITNFFSRLKK